MSWKLKPVGIDYRVPYGVISNRHSKGALPGEYPLNNADIYTKVIPIDMDNNIGTFRPENDRPKYRLTPQAVYGHHGCSTRRSRRSG